MQLINTKIANFEIDILKFLFSLVIVFHHWHFHSFETGYLAVEFYFIISGYFFTYFILNKQKYRGWEYILKSIKKISPYLFAGIIISLSWNFIFNNWTVEILWTNIKLAFVGEMLHFQMFGLPMFSSTGVVWYLSAMYIGMAIVTIIFQKNKEVFPTLQLILIVFFLYGWINIKRGSLQDPGFWLGHTFVGTLRRIAGIALGALCYKFTDFIKNFDFNIKGKIFISVIEVLCYLLSVVYMWKNHPCFWDSYIILALFVAISISLSEKSLFSFINHWYLSFFRTASICILFSHFYVCTYFEKNYPQFTGMTLKLLVVIQIIILSGLTFLISYLIKKIVPIILKSLKTLPEKESLK